MGRADSEDVADHRAWFEDRYVAAGAGEFELPWAKTGPHPLLAEWAGAHGLTGAGRRAMVVGCGLGGDAEFLAGLGFATEAFDFAPTAIEMARSRFPGSAVRYRVADLLDAPSEWDGAFDFVFESLTVQSLPRRFRADAIGRVRRMVAPGGTLLVIAAQLSDEPDEPDGPWPLSRSDVDSFAAGDLTLVRAEEIPGPDTVRWRAEFRRA